MARQDLTEIICIIDKSGSMDGIRKDAIGGFNVFVGEQKKVPGEARISLTLFHTTSEDVYIAKRISEVPPLSEDTYVPNGSTALLDAVGKAIDQAGKRFAAMAEDERPGKVMVAILTDGEENASRHYSRTRVFDMISHQREEYGWEFTFLAANQDAFTEAESLGISAGLTANFVATEAGTKEAYSRMSEFTTLYRRNRKS
jgi:hypothetical protein